MKIITLIICVLGLNLAIAQIKVKAKLGKKSLVLFDQNSGLYGLKVDKKILLPCEYDDYYSSTSFCAFYNYNKKTAELYHVASKKIVLIGDFYVDDIDKSKNYQVVYFSDGAMQIFNSKGEAISKRSKNTRLIAGNKTTIVKDEDYYYEIDRNGFKLTNSINIKDADSTFGVYPFDDNGYRLEIKKSGSAYLVPDKKPFAFQEIGPYSYIMSEEMNLKTYFAILSNMRTDYDELIVDLMPKQENVEPKLWPAYVAFIKAIEEESPEEFYTFSIGLTYEQTNVSVPFPKDQALRELLEFPVTGLSIDQVNNLAKFYSHLNETAQPYDGLDRFRLPTNKEWEKMAASGLKEPMKSRNILDSANTEGCMLFIYKDMPNCDAYDGYIRSSKGGGSIPCDKMNPDWNGVLNLFGNVSELTSDGFIKGGSFDLPAQDANLTNKTLFVGPSKSVGVRFVLEFKIQ